MERAPHASPTRAKMMRRATTLAMAMMTSSATASRFGQVAVVRFFSRRVYPTRTTAPPMRGVLIQVRVRQARVGLASRRRQPIHAHKKAIPLRFPQRAGSTSAFARTDITGLLLGVDIHCSARTMSTGVHSGQITSTTRVQLRLASCRRSRWLRTRLQIATTSLSRMHFTSGRHLSSRARSTSAN